MAMDQETARVTLYNEVYVPAFLNKCAEFGLTFNSPEDVVLALENAALVKHACEQLEAQNSSGLMKNANAVLKHVIGLDQPAQEKQAVPVNDLVLEALAALNG